MTAPVTAPALDDEAIVPAGRGRWLGLAVISLGVSLIIIDATIVNMLLPRIVGDLDLRTTDAEWLTSIYSLVFAAFLISFGRVADVVGRRRMFVLGTVVFVLASLLAARSGSGAALIGARALQGVGASMIMPATLSTINTLFQGRDRAIAFGIWGSLIGGMSALGPLIGGWLATSYSWRAAFLVNLPIGLLLIAGVIKFIPETRDTAGQRGIDWLGGLVSALGLGALVFALIEGQQYGWWRTVRPFEVGPLTWSYELSPIPVALVAAVLLMVGLLFLERARVRRGLPVMLDLSLFRIASFRRGNVAASLISVGELGLLFVLPLFLQGAHGDNPLQICVAIVPLAVGAFLSGPFAARLSQRVGAARVVQFGMAAEVAAVLAIGLTTHAGTTGFGLAPWMLMYGLGLGLTSAQLTNVSLADVPKAQSGQAAGTQSTARQVGSALGIALIGTVFATSLGHAVTAETGDSALAEQIQTSAGTTIKSLDPVEAHAAIQSLAVATGHAALTTAGILAVGLIMTLRLRRKD
ncbi:MAG: MFS transporter [Streptosporangiaceae bacterium]